MSVLRILFVVVIIAAVLPSVVEWYYSVTISKLDDDYDFIIVGAGTTGNVIANRLTENSDVKVLVLEAGDNDAPDPRVSVPNFAPLMQLSTKDWQYKTVPQKHACKTLKNKVSSCPRGKVIGGSSAMNYMIYVRGHPNDFDSWEKMGATGWKFDKVLPYFKKSEDAVNLNLTRPFHSKKGELKTSYPYASPLSSHFLNAGIELGYNIVDYNGPKMEGFSHIQSTIYKGQRQTSATAFIRPIIQQRRDRLHIMGRAHVRQIVFENDRAVGVRFVRDGVEMYVSARKEIIVSAGAIGTPQLLMLSGVGPKKHLEEHGIKPVADLPGVGSNLQDHICVMYPMIATNLRPGMLTSTYDRLTSTWEYISKGTGPLNSTGVDALAFLNSKLSDGRPDVMIFHQSVPWSAGLRLERIAKVIGLNEQYKNRLSEWAQKENRANVFDFFMMVGLLRPNSVGSVRLQSNKYTDHPIIDPNYLSKKKDVDILVEGFRFAEKIEQTNSFKELNASSFVGLTDCGEPPPIPRPYSFYECYARSLTMTVFHVAGTAKIGTKEDPMAVVDPRLRVYKVKNLRIADASVMPEVTSGTTQAPCYMIGEKASDMIKEDWNLT